jgi:hypothetical protein
MTIEADGVRRISAEIAASIYESFGGAVDRGTIVDAVDEEFARYVAAPVQDFVPLLVERDVRARLRGRGGR